MAGSLGASSLVCLLNNGDQGRLETSQNLLGPFWRMHSPRVENGGSIVRSDTPGSPLFVNAKVIDREGVPVAGAEVDVWHASPDVRHPFESHAENLGLFSYALAKARSLIVAAEP